LQQFGDTDIDTIVAWTWTWVGRLHLAVFGGFQCLFVLFLFLALDLVLAVDRSQKEVDGLTDETLTRGGGRGNAGHKGKAMLLLIEVLKTHTGCQCSEDRQRCNNHRWTKAFGYSPAY
jgi:hypothetical protein